MNWVNRQKRGRKAGERGEGEREKKTVSYFCKPQTFGKQKKRELGPNSISHWRLCIISSRGLLWRRAWARKLDIRGWYKGVCVCSRPGELLPPISLRMRLGLPKPGQIDPHLIRGPRLYPSLLNFYEAPQALQWDLPGCLFPLSKQGGMWQCRYSCILWAPKRRPPIWIQAFQIVKWHSSFFMWSLLRGEISLRFKKCFFPPTYHSLSQTRSHSSAYIF